MRPLVLGTAGHIDHGKTWLVRALTGKDTDRLPEEKERGISIDLGYAPLELPDGRRLSIVDVPGHERFVRNMVAGATGIDLFLLVVDAAEGARPQTHEHLAILRLLGIGHGVVAITKADAVDEETLALALEEGRELVPGAPVVATSARTGAGLDELVTALAGVAGEADSRAQHAHAGLPTRLFVDRSFSLRGIGTVVTGTLWSGSVGEGDELLAEPTRTRVRVRSVQVHDRPVERAEAGQRVALALPGLDRTKLRRGDALVEPGAYPTSYRLDVQLDELDQLDDHARVHVHHGTADHYARLVRVGERFAQLRLATPAIAARGDRFVLRDRTTVGGGVVLDPAPPRRTSAERLALLERGDPASIVRAALTAASEPLARAELARRAVLGPASSTRVSPRPWSSAASTRHVNGSTTWPAPSRSGSPTERGRAPSIRASRSPSSCRHGPGRRRRSPCCRWSAGAPRRTLRAPARSSAIAPRRQPSSRRSSPRAASPRSRPRTAAWPCSSKSRAGSSGWATGSCWASRRTRRPAGCSSTSARRAARSRSRASVTGSASDDGRPRSCSSASTPTA